MHVRKWTYLIILAVVCSSILRNHDNLFMTIGGILFGIVITALLITTSKKPKLKNKKIPKMTNNQEKHYEENGLSASEIKLFRQTMQTAKEQIIQLEKNLAESTKLQSIDLHHDTLEVSKHFFQLITKEPLRLTEANTFLYSHLPSIVELTTHYLSIEQHEIKNKATYDSLSASAQTIDNLAAEIRKDYHQFVAEDFEELQEEMNYAKQQMKKAK